MFARALRGLGRLSRVRGSMPAASSAEDPPRPLGLAHRIVYALLTIVWMLALLEVVARGLVGAPVARVGPFDAVAPFIADPTDPAHRITNSWMTDVYGRMPVMWAQRFLAHKPPGHLRVLLVGGSSIFQMQDQLDPMRDQLAAALHRDRETIEILNGGANAQGSAGVLHVVTSCLEYELDAVVVYSAHNEYAQHLVREEGVQGWRPWLTERSALWSAMQRGADAWHLGQLRAARAHAEIPAGPSADAPSAGHRAVAVEALGTSGKQEDPPDIVAQRYARNLALLVEEARAAGVAVVLSTVPSNLLAPAWGDVPEAELTRFRELVAERRYVEAAALSDAMLSATLHLQATHVENDLILALAAQERVPLADVRGAVTAASPEGVPGPTLFIDHCHLTDRGRQIWVQTVVPVLASALAARGP